MTEPFDYITLSHSDVGTWRFNVLAQGYNDGVLQRDETIKHTMGGKIDHVYGSVFRSWNPIIKVRETETETGYGSLSDLIDFYTVDPNSTGGAKITFTDHHGDNYDVHIVGKFNKELLTVSIEGTEAYYIVGLNLIEV